MSHITVSCVVTVMMSEFSLFCFNADKGQNKDEDESDLCFLQEILKNEIDFPFQQPTRASYEVVYLQENYNNAPYNCLFYNKSKFSVVKSEDKECVLHEDKYDDDNKPAILKLFEEKLKSDGDPLKKRACVAILQCNGSKSWNPRIIFASFHNPTKKSKDKMAAKNTDKSADKKATDKRTDKSADKKAADKRTDKPADKKATDKSTDKLADKKATDKSTDVLNEKAAADKDTDKTDKKSGKANAAENTGETGDSESTLFKRMDNAEHFFMALDYLGKMTGYPVVVGGDFNCELLNPQGIDTCGFTIPQYNPTIHRALTGTHSSYPCIDFFAYKNYSGCTKIVLSKVHAELASSPVDSLIKGTDGQYYLDYNECKYITDKKADSCIKKIHDISDHDPLRATLHVESKPPILTISYCNVKNNQNAIKVLKFNNLTSDLIILHNSDTKEEFEGYNRKEFTSNSTILFYKEMKLCSDAPVISQDSSTQSDFKYPCLRLLHQERKDLLLTFIFIDKASDNHMENIEKLLKQLQEPKLFRDLIIIMGNFSFTELNLPRKCTFLEQRNLPSDSDSKYFIACLDMTNTQAASGAVMKFYSLNVAIHPMTDPNIATKHIHHQAIMKFDLTKNAHDQADTTSDNTTNNNSQELTILSFNMDNIIDCSSISAYFANLNPKPDILILQQLQGIDIVDMLGIYQHSVTTCNGSTIVYNGKLFEFIDAPVFEGTTVCIIRCLKVDSKPEIVVASFSNPELTSNTPMATTAAKNCLHITSTTYKNQAVLIGGGFNVELDTLKTNNYGFEMPQCDLTIPRVLKLANTPKKTKNICTDYFAYRSGNNTSITLEDVHTESVEPCQGLVTGLHGCNIDYDKGIRNLPDVITDHDPVRAKLIIKTQPAPKTPTTQQLSSESLDATPSATAIPTKPSSSRKKLFK